MPSLTTLQQHLADIAIRAPRILVRSQEATVAASAFLDTVAVACAAFAEAQARPILRYAGDRHGGRARLWTTGTKALPEVAALINASLAHLLDYDDVAPDWRGHPSAVFFPALLAAKPACSFPELFDAYCTGYQIAAELSSALGSRHYERGWHSTATIGVIAAAAAVARINQLPPPAAVNALGIAASRSSGLRANFGTTTKPLHAGFAASEAVRSARLALLGIDASPQALDGPHGFLSLFGEGGTWRPQPIQSCAVGKLEAKAFPSCYATHRAIEAALRLRAEPRFEPNAVEKVVVSMSPGSGAALLQRPPTNPTEAKFSIQYCVAVALLHGKVGLSAFSDEAFAGPAVRRLSARIEVGERPFEQTGRLCRVETRLWNGHVAATTVGSLARPEAAAPVLSGKVLDCLSHGGFAPPPDAAARLFEDAAPGGVERWLQDLAPAAVKIGRGGR